MAAKAKATSGSGKGRGAGKAHRSIKGSSGTVQHRSNPNGRITGGKPTGTPPKK